VDGMVGLSPQVLHVKFMDRIPGPSFCEVVVHV